MNNLKTEKEQLRKDIRDLLRQMTSDQRQNWSGIITGKILELPEYQQAKTIMVFLSLAREYDTMDFIAIALKAGKIVCAPKVNWPAWSMEPVQLESIEDMAADEHNLKEPTGNKKIFPDTIDLILTPGLAFDLAGHRVGRGGGFYDHFISRSDLRGFRLAPTFDFQIRPSVPFDSHDQRVDMILSPGKQLRFVR